MAQQSPTISIPRKTTEEVDWTTPIKHLIAQSYGENPENYSAECAALQRCRQDAVRGAGSDLTGRDLLYKYFGQLELLELRFSEIRVSFPWRDAFTNKLTTQTSLAFEKASIIFQIAATHSSIAASQNRSDPEGSKRAFFYFRACAGMLTYINDNFLHAPSTDLSREVVKFLVGIAMAQANEIFYEQAVDTKKALGLVAKIAAQTSFLYNGLVEEVKEFMGKGIFDRNWVTLLQIKAKYFTSLAQYRRSLADSAAGKHGEALARLIVAEANAKEANRSAQSFSSYFVTALSPTLPADAGSAILELTKAHLALCTEKKVEGHRDNDLIYNVSVPSEATLPALDKVSVVTHINIQDVYGVKEVQDTIGKDLFQRLVPLSVHESASVYSEEKAKLVRGEVQKSEDADAEVRAALESLGVKSGIQRFRDMVESWDQPGSTSSVPQEVKEWKDEIARKEREKSVETLIHELERLKEAARGELDAASRDLEIESRDCEAMRVKHEHLWTQGPSAPLTKDLRQDLKSHLSALDAAAPSDGQIFSLWNSTKPEISLLLSPQLDSMFATEESAGALLEIDNDEEERDAIIRSVSQIEDRLGKLNKITRERGEVLKDLKEKIQTDDVSHLLLVNRRNAGAEPAIFAMELEKFRPYQSRIGSTLQLQQATLQEISQLWLALKKRSMHGAGAKKWEEGERKRRETVKRFAHAREAWMTAREGIQKGLQFYKDLTELIGTLRRNITTFVSTRTTEREKLASQLETQRRLKPATPPPAAPPPVPPPPRPLEQSFQSLNLGSSPNPNQWSNPSFQPQSPDRSSPFPPPPQPHRQAYTSPPPQQHRQAYASPPPPPPPPTLTPAPPPPQPYTPAPGPAQSQSYNPAPGPAQSQPYTPAPGPAQSQPYTPAPQSQPYAPAPPPSDPYSNLFSAPGLSSQFALQPTTFSPPPPPPGQNTFTPPTQISPGYPPPVPTRQQSYPPPPPSQQFTHPSQSPPPSTSPFPPPPPSVTYSTQHFGQQPYSPQQVEGQQWHQSFPPPPQQQTQAQQHQVYGQQQPGTGGYGYR